MKLLADGSLDPTHFVGTISNGPDTSFDVVASNSSTDNSNTYEESASQTHDVVETPVPSGYTLDGYAVIAGTSSAGRCFPNQDNSQIADVVELGLDLTATATIPADSQDYVVCIVNHRDPVHVIVHKNYILNGATFDAGQDIPTVHVIDGGDQTPGNDGQNPTTYDTVDVDAGSISVTESLDTSRWGFVSVTVTGQGCTVPNFQEQLGGDTQLLIALENLLVGDLTFNAEPDSTCVVTYTNERLIGHIQVVKADGTFGLPGRPSEWDFTVSGSTGPYNLTIPLGGGNSSIVDVPVGGTYTAAEDNGDLSECPDINESGTWRTQALDGPLSITTPGQTIIFHFSNQPCDVLLGSGTLIIHKYGDLNGNHILDAGEQGIAGWTINVQGPEFPSGQDFVTDGSGTIFLPGVTDGFYTLTETSPAGYTVIGVVNVNDNTFNPAATGTGTVSNGETTVINFFNRPTVNIHVTKTEVLDGVPVPGSGWAITVSGCGNSYGPTSTNASGYVDFTGLPLCAAGYTVSENPTSKSGFAPSGGVSHVVIADTAGTTYTVAFTNVHTTPGCTTCNNVTPTPVTPTSTPPTPTSTTNPPTATPTSVPPTNTPTPLESTLGEKTPGPGASATPLAPSTGSGLFGTSRSSTNMLLVLFGFSLSVAAWRPSPSAAGSRAANR